ncbi:hypothetical protein [Parasphaerochaeta coccoides]|uniref:DNA binding domain protein, excisionase family n=1 Tax=Parasphaerochaeta coccoides (strain ATCC BAA-1237 / DSM 17374 / SPN1) TaxID=760011 RepID=F4GI73_PARC1|nr:hypothetical protein [Parasphaerochaeta coccoides]AEC02671.1 DNA binding domain protein, excisionase family [Parasphaerochaeta coccoides DSM 17374]
MSKYITVKEAAAELGVTTQTIAQTLRGLGVEKFGGIYLIDDTVMEQLKSRKGKSGRPKGAKNKVKTEARLS